MKMLLYQFIAIVLTSLIALAIDSSKWESDTCPLLTMLFRAQNLRTLIAEQPLSAPCCLQSLHMLLWFVSDYLSFVQMAPKQTYFPKTAEQRQSSFFISRLGLLCWKNEALKGFFHILYCVIVITTPM